MVFQPQITFGATWVANAFGVVAVKSALVMGERLLGAG